MWQVFRAEFSGTALPLAVAGGGGLVSEMPPQEHCPVLSPGTRKEGAA